jgi:hypothetical protein
MAYMTKILTEFAPLQGPLLPITVGVIFLLSLMLLVILAVQRRK